MSNVAYPRIPRDLKKSVKLSYAHYDKIKSLANQGLTLKEISIKYNVSQSTIYYALNPDKYEIMCEQLEQKKKEQYHNDEDYKIKTEKSRRAWQKSRIKNDLEYKTYWNFIHNQARIRRGDNFKPRSKEQRHLEYLRRKERNKHD